MKMKKNIILVAFLVLVVIGVLGMQFLPISRERTRQAQCYQNLKMIYGSVEHQGALAHGLTIGDPIPMDVLAVYCLNGKWPCCPSGKEYKIGRIGEIPTCPVHGDLLHGTSQDFVGWKCCQWVKKSNYHAGRVIIEKPTVDLHGKPLENKATELGEVTQP
ncbi:MAG: hypothetical protein A2283_24000 [Lentisphaerae bacterium RIFOXYA12_FULL_48_11]|nr:MAG: hypothetical protein A2283_24000 [Lentisphaerae bacterium RIFOXYA12_FULL_48_11]